MACPITQGDHKNIMSASATQGSHKNHNTRRWH